MEFTGERYVPSHPGITRSEHIHRYAVAASLVADKHVLDIACGEGYGADIYAKSAASVMGVDIDAACVDHARMAYGHLPNVHFAQGSADAIPLPDASVDVVTSFETLEHHDRHEEMLREIKRVLKPGGLLIISTPNHPVYSRNGSYTNPYHVKELDRAEFENLLRRYFRNTLLCGQTLSMVSAIAPVQSPTAHLEAFSADPHNTFVQDTRAVQEPKYFFAVCSDVDMEQKDCPASIYFDAANNNLEAALADTTNRLECAQNQIRVMQSSTFWQLREKWWRLRCFRPLPLILASLAAVATGLWIKKTRQ